MLKESRANEEFQYQKLSPEEQKSRGILGRLVGVAADFINPTRNGRKYSSKLWENVFNDPIMKEKIANHCCFGELGHPSDRTETDMEKIAICLAEQPVKRNDGKLMAVFDILDTPNGRILKSLCDYGCNIGISSRGEGDLVTDYDGNESVDPETYSCECWDAVLIPAVKEARMKYVTESLNRKSNNKTLRESLKESLDAANDVDRKIMKETLDNLKINLTEESSENMADFNGKLPIIDFGNGYFYVNIENGKLQAGNVTNNGFYSEYEIDYDQDVSLDENIQALYDYILEINPDMIPNQNEDAVKEFKRENESLIESAEVTDGVIIDTKEDGFLTKKHELEADGYKTAWVGNGKICLVKPKELNTDIKDESLNINEESKNTAVDNNEAIVEELQKLIKANAGLEQQIITLQEKLSVCYAKESKFEEDTEKYKKSVKVLAESAKQTNALKAKVLSLESKLNESNGKEVELNKKLSDMQNKVNGASTKASELRESISTKSAQVDKLNESITSLNNSLAEKENENKELKESLERVKKEAKKAISNNNKIVENFKVEKQSLNENISQLQKDLSLQKNEYAQKIDNAKKLIEKYKKATTTAIDKYIELQAVRLGSSVNEVKNRLPESYSFTDIDKVCEDLQDYKLNMSRLPFNALQNKLNEGVKVKGTSSKNESILPATNNAFDDDIDADLLYLAGRK